MSNDEDFASVIENSQRSPHTRDTGSIEVNDLFERAIPRDHRVVREGAGEKIPGAVEYDYQCHVEYFSIPEQKTEYEAVMNSILNAEGMLRYEDRTFTKEGDCIIVVCYLTRTVNQAKTAKRQKRTDDEEREGYLREDR